VLFIPIVALLAWVLTATVMWMRRPTLATEASVSAVRWKRPPLTGPRLRGWVHFVGFGASLIVGAVFVTAAGDLINAQTEMW
jgi:hypothetical protein